MSHTTAAVQELRRAVESPCRAGQNPGAWRWTVRQRMAEVRDVLVAETTAHDNAWLAARGGSVRRERNALLLRLGELGPQVLEVEDLETVRTLLRRVVQDLEHHLQRVSDLAYDAVGLEIGGSE